jgi:hypothetical protein
MEEEAPNKRNEVAILSDHVLVLILSRLTTHSYAAASVFVAPEITHLEIRVS